MAKKASNKESSENILEKMNKKSYSNRPKGNISCGIPVIDMVFSGSSKMRKNMGFPRGKMYTITGKAGTGKSTFLIELTKRWANNGYNVLYLDFEGGLNNRSLDSYGLAEISDEDEVIYDSPNTMIAETHTEFLTNPEKNVYIIDPETFQDTRVFISAICDEMKKSNSKIDVVIIDSRNRIKNKETLDPEYKSTNMDGMRKAKIEGEFWEYYRSIANHYGFFTFTVTQYRTKMSGAMAYEGESGGNSYQHDNDTRLVMKKKTDLVNNVKDNFGNVTKNVFGCIAQISSYKSRMGVKPITLPLIYGKGISLKLLYTSALEDVGIVKSNGGWSTIDVSILTDSGYEVNSIEGKMRKGKVFTWLKNNYKEIERFILDNNILTKEYTAPDSYNEDAEDSLKDEYEEEYSKD